MLSAAMIEPNLAEVGERQAAFLNVFLHLTQQGLKAFGTLGVKVAAGNVAVDQALGYLFLDDAPDLLDRLVDIETVDEVLDAAFAHPQLVDLLLHLIQPLIKRGQDDIDLLLVKLGLDLVQR